MNFQKLYNELPYTIQKLLFTIYCKNLYYKRYNANFGSCTKENIEFEKYSVQEMKEYQNDLLVKLINHSYNTVPYYNKVMKANMLLPTDIKGIDDLYKMPLLTRSDIALNGNDLISVKYNKKNLVHGHTSGTTGSPLSFYWDYHMWFLNNLFDWRQKRWAGMKLGDPYAILLGRTIVPVNKKKPPFWQYNKYENQLWVSSFHLSDEYISDIYNKLLEFKPLYLEGYPSTLYILAYLLKKHRVNIKLKAALTSSETLFDYQKDLIEEVFDCKLFDFYGQAERVIWATECNSHKGKHLSMDYGITEITDDIGNLVNNGEYGYLVGTSLHNYGMPFIRYQMSDMSCFINDKCACGSDLPLIDNIRTKQEDVIITPSGRYISSSILTHPFKPLKNLIMSQLVQDRPDHLIVNLVVTKYFEKNDTVALLQGLSERIGKDVVIDVAFVDKISREKSGKFKWVKSNQR